MDLLPPVKPGQKSTYTPVRKTGATSVISCVVLMVFLPWKTWIRLAIWLAIGFAIYFGYGQKHSRLSAERS